MTGATLSVAVITFNEERRLRACLESVAWADEIVVVDSESTDKTLEVARAFTDRIVVRPWPGYAAQKNFAIAQTRGDWVLSLDADEEVSSELADEIRAILARRDGADAYAVARRNIFWGAWVRHGGLYPDSQVRLFRRGRAAFGDRAVHESIHVDGRVERLRGALVHRSYDTIEEFLERAQRYSALAATERVRGGDRVRLTELLTRPLGRFAGMYVLRLGFLDGWRGFLLAVLYGYYVFIRSAKAWEMTRVRNPR